MKRTLSFRLSTVLILYTGFILVIASIAMINATHYHFQMYGREMSEAQHSADSLNSHLEQAIIQSIGLTIGGALIVSFVLSVYIAKRISSPLISMKNITLIMARGKRDVRLPLKSLPKDELEELAASINHLAEQLEQQEKLRIAMTENIAHELRTPLTTLNSYLAAIQDGIWEPTPERIQSSREEIHRLIQLVHDLEELQIVNSIDFQFMLEQVSLKKSIDQVMDLMRPSFQQKGVNLEKKDIPNVCVIADESRLIQIWTNLLSNALKYTPEGGTVEVKGTVRLGMVQITVSDNGIGIPSADLPHIFERFYRVDKSRSRKMGGGGLGLAITKTLVERHGGQIWAESDHGAQFYVQLPIQR